MNMRIPIRQVFLLSAFLLSSLGGCGGHADGVIVETEEHSFDNIAAELAAEEAAAKQDREK